MAAFTHPITWFRQTLRRWQERERQALAEQFANDPTNDLYHERNTSFWFLPPPC